MVNACLVGLSVCIICRSVQDETSKRLTRCA